MYWIVSRLVPALQRPRQGLQHCQQTRPLVHPFKTEMPPKFCQSCAFFPWWHDGQGNRKWRYVWTLSCHKQCQARVCPGQTRFSLRFSKMFLAALSQTKAGIKIQYRTDGCDFDLRHLKANTKVHEAQACDFLSADDCMLAAHWEDDLQHLADCFSTTLKAHEIMTSIKKTDVLHQTAPGTSRPEPSIKIDGSSMRNVEDFTYLSSSSSLDREISCCLAKASSSFGWHWTRVWHECGITQKIMGAVYRGVVLTSPFYGCQTWTCYCCHIKKLDKFHLRCLCRL